MTLYEPDIIIHEIAIVRGLTTDGIKLLIHGPFILPRQYINEPIRINLPVKISCEKGECYTVKV